jgi:hypothetical protein
VDLVDEEHIALIKVVDDRSQIAGSFDRGPEVERRFTPSSRAIICASEVLPSPGGPENSTWSSTSPRFRAASIDIPSTFLIRSWPTNSASERGRSEKSSSRSTLAGSATGFEMLLLFGGGWACGVVRGDVASLSELLLFTEDHRK